MTAIEAYAAPTTVEETAKLVADGHATVFAGGTDLMLQTASGAKAFARLLVNLRRVTEMHGVTQSNGSIRIGALTTISEILHNEMLGRVADILPTVADRFACGQVRNSATVGGNICNASPAGDMIIPLLLLDANAELTHWANGALNRRLVSLAEFFVAPGKTVASSNEVLTSVVFQAPGTDFVARFQKFGTRPAMDISVVSVGVAGRMRNGALRDARVAFGAVAPTPLRGAATEAALDGRTLDESVVAAATDAAVKEISPISDVRASAWYRYELIKTLTGRVLRDVAKTGN